MTSHSIVIHTSNFAACKYGFDIDMYKVCRSIFTAIYITTVAALEIFFRVVIIDQNLIKIKLYVLTKTHTVWQFYGFDIDMYKVWWSIFTSILTTMVALGLFFRVIIIDQNLIKIELHVLTKIHTQFDKFLRRIFLFWNLCMIVSLSMLQVSYLSNL